MGFLFVVLKKTTGVVISYFNLYFRATLGGLKVLINIAGVVRFAIAQMLSHTHST
jgi:hypothetical protein